MSNTYDRILHHLEQAGRSPVRRSALLREMATLGESSNAVSRALQLLIQSGQVRRVGDLYVRVLSTWPKSEERGRSSGNEAAH